MLRGGHNVHQSPRVLRVRSTTHGTSYVSQIVILNRAECPQAGLLMTTGHLARYPPAQVRELHGDYSLATD